MPTKHDYDYLLPEFALTNDKHREVYYRAEVFLRQGGQSYDLYGWEKVDIINDVINQFENYRFRHHSRAAMGDGKTR